MVVQIVTNLKGPNGFGGKAYTYFVSYVCIHLSAKNQKAKKTFPVEKHSDNQSCSTTENEISPIYLDWCSLSALNTDTDTEFIFPKIFILCETNEKSCSVFTDVYLYEEFTFYLYHLTVIP